MWDGKEPKELLNKDKCKLDLMTTVKTREIQLILGLICCLLVSLLAGFAMASMLSRFIQVIRIVLIVMMALFFCGIYAFFIFILICIIRTRYRIKKEQFDLVEDVLVDRKKNIRVGRGKNAPLFDMLVFGRYGEYLIHRENYKWSNRYAMKDRDVYCTSFQGDAFYLVLYLNDKKKKIAMVYNKKFFDRCNDENPKRNDGEASSSKCSDG